MTAETKHTPGPWSTEVDGTAWRVLSADGLVCEMPLGWSDGSPVGDERLGPDARLVAAAPELLASVIELLEPLERASAAMVEQGRALNEHGEAAFDRARAAIAKATEATDHAR